MSLSSVLRAPIRSLFSVAGPSPTLSTLQTRHRAAVAIQATKRRGGPRVRRAVRVHDAAVARQIAKVAQLLLVLDVRARAALLFGVERPVPPVALELDNVSICGMEVVAATCMP